MLGCMGFSKRRMKSERAAVAAKEAEARRALGPQILTDAEHLIATWNARQEARMPMLFSPTIGAAMAARHWWLWVRCPACRTTDEIDKPFLLRDLLFWISTGDRVAKSRARGCQPDRAAVTVAPHWRHPCAVSLDHAAATG